MASLDKLAIRGIRSFDDKQISVMQFFSPVTVIVGPNGSGKTTIIECLKYATTGDQPPNTRGGAFVHDPKMANEKEVKAQVKLRFNAANGTKMLAVRNLSVTMKKNMALTMKTLENILAVTDENGGTSGGKRGVISTKCAEIDTEIPHLLGVSKAVLENVIFCHQEDSYWPLAEPSVLKKKFDDIFEATRYTKAIDNIKNLRKERVADLKAEKERLESLYREKSHADKLKERILDLNAKIAKKGVEYDRTKKAYDQIVISNKSFYEGATKFRETYLKVENLEKRKEQSEGDLKEGKINLQQELPGTEAELEKELSTYGEKIREKRRRQEQEDNRRQDLEEELAEALQAQMELSSELGRLMAEQKAQERQIEEREELIREIAAKYQLKGYDHSQLEKEEVAEFIARLDELQTRQEREADKIQDELSAKNKEYNEESRRKHAELERTKQQKESLRTQIANVTKSIADNELALESSATLSIELRTLSNDMEEKRSRIAKTKTDIKDARYDERLAEKAINARKMEEQRDTLNTEQRGLNLQADVRARLDVKRREKKEREAEVKNTLEIQGPKFRKLTGSDAKAENMERELDRVMLEKEREHAEAESQSNRVNRDFQQAETTLSTTRSQLENKTKELKALSRKLENELEGVSLDAAIKEATIELNLRKELSGRNAATTHVWDVFLKTGKTKKVCKACNRPLGDHELPSFETYIKEQMKRSSPEAVAENEAEMATWEEELQRLQALTPVAAARDRLKDVEIPALENQVKVQESVIPSLSEKADTALTKFSDVKKELRDLTSMKQHATRISQCQKDIARLEQEIRDIENGLSASGSTRTAGDVQSELDSLTMALRANERERQTISTEKDRHQQALRAHEDELHKMQLQEGELNSKVREKASLESRTEEMKKEIVEFTARLKTMDERAAEAQAPIRDLEEKYQRVAKDLEVQLAHAQRLLQELNKSVDKFEMVNKAVERYVREKRGRQLRDCEERIEQAKADIKNLGAELDDVRARISAIDQDISQSTVSMTNLRENLRVKKLQREIVAIQAEIDACPMEEAAKYRRHFEEQYPIEKEKENRLQSEYAHIGGELSSLRAQLETLESDLKEFKDIEKTYTDQLIRVKMSDLANNDLEKYAKALDNAIMKYHTLKMEEVNETMRYLWNRTYQGTDIDGIKIRSDNEGGTTKRSYNYRVVMTKDQVEMDMRGRCSAGQKMLASIIIRLALSDSFGQNCGILALDEPTNALDTENIDALAASLVDIINERKNHSNFQLVIITHDENFLRKLGQSDVMEYYWRVGRDSRQKSIIERHRFR